MRNRHFIELGIVCLILTAVLSSVSTSQTSPPATTTKAAAAPAASGSSAATTNQAVEPAGTTVALPSKAFLWNELEARTSDFGVTRPIFRSPTATLDELEIHATSLKPGQRPHPPHQHAYEEMLVLREGTLEATVNDRVIPLTAGSVLFLAPNDMHGWQNKGTEPANYYIITWRTARTAAAKQ